jgi:hypothetical protein
MYGLHTVIRSLCTVVTYLQSTIIDTSQAARYRTCSDIIFRVTLSSTSLVPHKEHSMSQLQRPFTERNKSTVASVILTTTGILQQIFVKIPNVSFYENKASESRVVPCGRQTDRQTGGRTDMNRSHLISNPEPSSPVSSKDPVIRPGP